MEKNLELPYMIVKSQSDLHTSRSDVSLHRVISAQKSGTVLTVPTVPGAKAVLHLHSEFCIFQIFFTTSNYTSEAYPIYNITAVEVAATIEDRFYRFRVCREIVSHGSVLNNKS